MQRPMMRQLQFLKKISCFQKKYGIIHMFLRQISFYNLIIRICAYCIQLDIYEMGLLKSMRIVVVEDEHFVRRSLCEAIMQANEKWSVIGEASNGQEAIAILATVEADLLITDIRMPGMDGLQLTEFVYHQYPDLKIILLTGHKDFEYAQKAIQFDVVEYMLKPCSYESIELTIQSIENKIKMQKNEEKIKHLQNKDLLSKRMNDLLIGLPLPYFDRDLIPCFQSLVVFSIQLTVTSLQVHWSSVSARLAIQNLADEWLQSYGYTVSIAEDEQLTIIMLCSDTMLPETGAKDLQTAQQLRDQIKSILKLDIQVGCSKRRNRLEDLTICYKESLEAIKSDIPMNESVEQHVSEANQKPDSLFIEQHILSKTKRRVVALVIEIIHSRLSEELSLNSIADELFLNPSYLGRLFKEDTGESFSSFVTKTRIEKAKTLLLDITVKVYEVSEKVGYTDPAYFSYKFKRIVGMTPQDFQKLN
jgi:two-component system, response regulator YesN